MALFRRALNGLFLFVGFVVGIVAAAAVFFARYIITPPRQRLWATPADLGVAYDEVQFPAQDGIRLSGWFIPAVDGSLRQNATIILVHGWPWNRLGEAAEDVLSSLNGATPVDLLRLAYQLHQDGFHVLMFDLRNHGESASAPPITFGREEANDLLGAVAYLTDRLDVNNEQIGVVGFSMGANTTLYALSRTTQIKAAVAVQPTSADVFARRFGLDLLGPLAHVVVPLTQWLYQLAGGAAFATVQPAAAAAHAGDVPILYVQGKGDPWGTVADVAQMAAATAEVSGPLFVDTVDRFGGYQYVVNNPHLVTAFFEQHLSGTAV